MSQEKAESRARRLELLNAAFKDRLLANAEGGVEADNPDLHRLLRDGHMKEIRPKGERSPTGFEITPRGQMFRLDQMDPKERNREERMALPSFDHTVAGITSRGRYRDQLAERESTRRRMRGGAEGQRLLSRKSAATAALISAALREAEEEPFVLDTGWIDESEASRHYLWKMLKNDRHPNDGFTLYDRLPDARTIQIKKRLDGSFQDTFDLMVVRSLGGGAVVCHILSDELPAQQAEHDRLLAGYLEERSKAVDYNAAMRVKEPDYQKFVPYHRLLLLSSGESMNLYLQMAFR